MSNYRAYYAYDGDEERYLRFLEAPGDGLGMVLGDAPTVEDVLARGGTVFVKAMKEEQPPKLVITDRKKKCMKCGSREWTDMHKDGVGDCCDKRMRKALPKKDKSAAPAKKAKSSKANKQVAGKTGKVRSSYPQEAGGQPAPQPTPQEQSAPPKPNPARTPPDAEEGPPIASPSELANILGTPVTSLQRIAHRFRDNKKLGGRSGFVTFMKTRLKRMANKHKLDGDYFGLIYDALCPKKPA